MSYAWCFGHSDPDPSSVFQVAGIRQLDLGVKLNLKNARDIIKICTAFWEKKRDKAQSILILMEFNLQWLKLDSLI